MVNISILSVSFSMRSPIAAKGVGCSRHEPSTLASSSRRFPLVDVELKLGIFWIVPSRLHTRTELLVDVEVVLRVICESCGIIGWFQQFVPVSAPQPGPVNPQEKWWKFAGSPNQGRHSASGSEGLACAQFAKRCAVGHAHGAFMLSLSLSHLISSLFLSLSFSLSLPLPLSLSLSSQARLSSARYLQHWTWRLQCCFAGTGHQHVPDLTVDLTWHLLDHLHLSLCLCVLHDVLITPFREWQCLCVAAFWPCISAGTPTFMYCCCETSVLSCTFWMYCTWISTVFVTCG